MKSPKALTSAIVAIAMAGGIGLAYAQTSDQGAGPGAPGGNAAFNSAPAVNSSADTNMATPVPATTGTDTSMQTERPAQADRN